MAKKGSAPINPPSTPEQTAPMAETQSKGEKDSIDQALSQAGRGIPEDELGTPKAKIFASIPLDGEELPSFELRIFRPFTLEEKISKLEEWSRLGKKIVEMEGEKKKFDDNMKKQINEAEAQRNALGDAVSAKGAEKDCMCRKRIDFEKGIATIFLEDTLEIVDRRKLNLLEMQTEMQLAGKLPEGKQGDVIAGPWGEAGKQADAGQSEPEADITADKSGRSKETEGVGA